MKYRPPEAPSDELLESCVLKPATRIARRDAPNTSLEAAEKITNSGKRLSLYMLIVETVKQHPNITTFEAYEYYIKAQKPKILVSTVRARFSEARDKHIFISGKRKCRVSGATACIWREI